MPITEFHQNKDSQFFNTVARRISTRGGPDIRANGSCAYAAALLTGTNATWDHLKMEDAMSFRFAPLDGSPMRGAAVTRPPLQPHAVDIGAYQKAETWQPGCTFDPRCAPTRPPWPR